MEVSQERTFKTRVIQWCHDTLIIVGVVAAIAFVRVNWFDGSFELRFPTSPLVMNPNSAKSLR